ncbi:TSCPD domain-containing protein [Amphritea balenae]|uniref:ribonucleoside-diphosphate reductase n=1 Tax=Amphritea balenae TaxID=452629 RepID=A0A3P1SM29_9GAMM|nr:NrdJb [Amphritea balenae]RRC98080.1 NrdJb [Amphritea balenae]GGK67400.1 TSCPD domain-containing protein [Amphritea balenae]
MNSEQQDSVKRLCISQPIIGYKVLTEEDKAAEKVEVDTTPAIEQVHENLTRPDFLMGSTYKIKTPMSEHALYITINDILLNQGTEHEQRHPYEIFINSKNMDHFMWVVALTRVISAVFRKGGDVTFMAEELKAVFDPKGGYFKKGGKFMPSLVAEIGEAIEGHLKMIGLLEEPGLDQHQQQILDEKRAEYEKRSSAGSAGTDSAAAVNDDNGGFPADAIVCNKCSTKAAILMDGCYTCLNCGDSKCG